MQYGRDRKGNWRIGLLRVVRGNCSDYMLLCNILLQQQWFKMLIIYYLSWSLWIRSLGTARLGIQVISDKENILASLSLLTNPSAQYFPEMVNKIICYKQYSYSYSHHPNPPTLA